ncbi:MAG: porin family protein [Candidatus Saccharicenans sp.]
MTKRFWLIFVSLLLFSLASEAQIISFGLKGGINLASFKAGPISPEIPQFKNLLGLSGGAFVSFSLGSFIIQPEFLYTRWGTKFDQIIDGYPYTVQYRLNYLEGVLLLKWRIINQGRFRPIVFAGLSYGLLTKAKLVLFDNSGSYVDSIEVKDMFKKSELAAIFGGGVEWKWPSWTISLEGRYHLGLSNIASSAGTEFIKNKGPMFMLAMAF